MVEHNAFNLNGKESIFMGIDQSLTNTGVTVIKKDFVHGKHDILLSRGIATDNTFSIEDRIHYIRTEIKDIIAIHKPEVICIEGLAFRNPNSNNGKLLAGLYFVLLDLFVEMKLQYFIVNIKTLKKKISGNGSATKEEMKNSFNDNIVLKLEEISRIKKTSKKFEDIIDSYGLSLFKILEQNDLDIKKAT